MANNEPVKIHILAITRYSDASKFFLVTDVLQKLTFPSVRTCVPAVPRLV